MKLSELVALRNLIKQVRPDNLINDIDRVIAPVTSAMMHASSFHEQQNLVAAAHCELHNTAQQYKTSVDAMMAEVQARINQLEPQYFANSYHLYESQLGPGARDDQLDIILERALRLDDTARQFIQTRITARGDWHQPAMIFRPTEHEWITRLVACDPLYLVDYRTDVVSLAVSKFNPEYQRRLRCYTIHEDREQNLFDCLPNNQFGFVLVYNFFHYRPFEVIKNYLIDLYQKLVPGGVIGFTFNDCDLAGAVDLAERFYMCYTPGELLRAMTESIGYDVQLKVELDQAVTWMEIVKPGRRASLRGGQSLATIHPLSKPVVQQDLNTYTNKQRRVLFKQASALGIEHADDIDLQMLEQLINESKNP